MTNKKPLLDLSTNNHVGNIVIDDKPYGLISIDCLSILERQRLTTLGHKLSKAGDIKTAEDEAKYNKSLLDILCLIMPDAGTKILSRLSITKRLNSVNAYMEASGLLTKKKVTRPTKTLKKTQ